MRRILSIAVALSAAACGYQEPQWTKAGGNFTEESYSCRRDAVMGGGAVYVGYGRTVREPDVGMFNHCMRSKGWSLDYPIRDANPGRVYVLQDVNGKVYQEQDRITCKFQSGTQGILPAKVCVQGTGFIMGPAA